MIFVQGGGKIFSHATVIHLKLFSNFAQYTAEKMTNVIQLLCLGVFSYFASSNLVYG